MVLHSIGDEKEAQSAGAASGFCKTAQTRGHVTSARWTFLADITYPSGDIG